jgi:hypothetical protein
MAALEPSSVDRAVMAEHKVDDEHAHDEEAVVVENSNELHGDLDRNNMGDAQVIRQQKIYIIKVPRFSGEDLWAKIQDAHAHLDKLTQERDAINIRKQKQKVINIFCNVCILEKSYLFVHLFLPGMLLTVEQICCSLYVTNTRRNWRQHVEKRGKLELPMEIRRMT